MRYQRGDEVVYRNGPAFVFGIVLGVVIAMGGIAAAINGGPSVPVLTFVAPAMWAFVGYMGVIRPRVVLTATEIRVYNPFSDEAIAYTEVASVDFAGGFWFWGTLEVDKGFGLTVAIWPGPTVGWGHRPGWLEYLAFEIKNRAKAAAQEEA